MGNKTIRKIIRKIRGHDKTNIEDREWLVFSNFASERLQDERRRKYDAYLRSWKWKQIRRIVLARDGNVCTVCHKETKDLQIHHITYSHIFHEMEDLSCLRTVCEKCHRRVHRLKD